MESYAAADPFALLAMTEAERWAGYAAVGFGYLLTLGLILHVLLTRTESRNSLAWILAILLLPIGGALWYLFFGNIRVTRPSLRRRHKRVSTIRGRLETRSTHTRRRGVCADQQGGRPMPLTPGDLSAAEQKLIRIAAAATHRPPTGGNATDLLFSGESVLERLLESIHEARHHIHFQYYIFRIDASGRTILEALIAAAQRGVEVRLLLDAVGSWQLRKSDLLGLQAAGGKVGWFFPVSLLRRQFTLNLRNHRKMAIIDGRVGYTGGLNIGEEYMKGRWRGIPWRDAHVRLEGPCVHELSEIFAEDWISATREDLTVSDRYFPTLMPAGEEVVQIVESGPDRDQRPLHEVIFAAITLAERSIRLTTPYFVPDESLFQALRVAAMRGVDVRLVLPGERTDHRLVYWCGRSFFEPLLRAGVKIFEYREGFIHAKVVSIDGRIGIVGSANMDERSFRLNFELNAVIYSKTLAAELDRRIDETVGESSLVSLEEFLQRPVTDRLAEATAHLFAPLL